MKQNLLRKIDKRTVRVGVVGLGYVGLPLAVEKAKAGFETVGFDVQAEKVDMVNAGHNYIGDVVDSDLAALVKVGKLRATTDFSFIKGVAVSYTHLSVNETADSDSAGTEPYGQRRDRSSSNEL